MNLDGNSDSGSYVTDFSDYVVAQNLQNELNEKYKKNFDQLKGENNERNYTFYEGVFLCDSFIPNYIDGRNLTQLKNTNLNFEEFYDFCIRILNETFSDLIPQKNKTLAYIQGSIPMELLVNYAKLRIDEDIKNISDNNGSSKKMLIVSGHDSTISAQEIFIINSLGKNLEFYRYPTFASQLTFEITRKDDKKSKRNYSDYFINYYFNEELLLNMTLSEFLDKMEPNIRTSDDNSNGNNNATQENNTNNNGNLVNKNKFNNLPLISVSCLLALSLFLNLFYIIK